MKSFLFFLGLLAFSNCSFAYTRVLECEVKLASDDGVELIFNNFDFKSSCIDMSSELDPSWTGLRCSSKAKIVEGLQMRVEKTTIWRRDGNNNPISSVNMVAKTGNFEVKSTGKLSQSSNAFQDGAQFGFNFMNDKKKYDVYAKCLNITKPD